MLNLLLFGYITELEKNGKVFHVVGNSLELNSASSFKIASDKFACFSVLASHDIPTIKYNMVFNPLTRSGYENNDVQKALLLFDNYGGEVVLKANDSCEGKDVFYIKSKEALKKKIIQEFEYNHDSVSVCPVYKIDYEYRCIFLDGEILLCYKKEKPYVIGNGKDTINNLILETDIRQEDLYDYIDLSYVPPNGEKVEVSWKHNLSGGASPILDIDKDIEAKVNRLAIDAGNSIGIRFASVDIVHDTVSDEYLVMEINSSVCMSKFAEKLPEGLKIEKEIFENAIDRMFES